VDASTAEAIIGCMAKKKRDILKRFGSRLRALRSEMGYSQEGFAAHCDLDRTYIGGVERGERNIALRNIEKIADALEIDIAELFEDI
jgi:transcriptional regulator with XRE-family HTH domain